MNNKKIMDHLLGLYDWYIRCIDKNQDDYICGYVDGLGQVILDLGQMFGEEDQASYKFEAYKRVMQFETIEKYKQHYPKPISKLQRT